MILRTGNSPRNSSRAFTLIELILVMSLIVIAAGLVTPMIKKFFDGRALDSEVKRFASLARYGQTRAVDEGIPMMLWIDSKNGKYGLEQEPGYTGDVQRGTRSTDSKALEFSVGEGVEITVAKGRASTRPTYSQTGRILAGAAGGPRANVTHQVGIHFMPGGQIAAERSVTSVELTEGKMTPVWLAPTPDGTSYDVTDQKTIQAMANARR